ncbi:MAG: hypothetical protein FIB05_07980 [Betaproteobacteria bacterium]|nr:hypothetical protein [Betaproteobacteria bacterium]PWB57788.1 MAG: hypothetical protein C3F16_14850 [Betaproteobacteria bacterium]
MKSRSIGPAAILLALALPAHAQPPVGAAAKNPGDPGAQVPSLQYSSPFAGYRPFAAGAVGPWKDMNDEVARIGGWKAYAREAYEASKQAAPATDGAANAPAVPKESPGPKAN